MDSDGDYIDIGEIISENEEEFAHNTYSVSRKSGAAHFV